MRVPMSFKIDKYILMFYVSNNASVMSRTTGTRILFNQTEFENETFYQYSASSETHRLLQAHPWCLLK